MVVQMVVADAGRSPINPQYGKRFLFGPLKCGRSRERRFASPHYSGSGPEKEHSA